MTMQSETRWRRLAPFLIPVTTVALSIVALPSFADHLDASDFEGKDGNQDSADGIADETEYDWEDLEGLPDLTVNPDNTIAGGDDSLAGGTKDNTECPDLTTGSIPPNKDNLQRFYLYHEVINDDVFLYLGYVRVVGSDTASAHGVFELNQSSTLCDESFLVGKGKNKVTIDSPFHERTTDDVRILFDYEGGDNPVIGFQTWDDTAQAWSNSVPLNEHQAEGQVNTGDINDYLNPDGDVTLTNRQFAEAKINLTEAGIIDPDDCTGFAAASLFTGASGNSDNEQSKDVITPDAINLDFCGDLTIEKYIDVDESGTENSGDVTNAAGDTLGDLDGWHFVVTGPDGSSDVACEGDTNAEGVLLCASLPTGEYVVTETVSGGFINTDPGDPSPYSKTVNVTTAGATVKFGNTCTIEKTFQVTSVPSGTTGLSAWYDTTVDNDQTAGFTLVTLTDQGGGTWSGTASEEFHVGDTIEWGYQVGSDVVVEGDETFAVADGYPACSRTNTREFDDSELKIVKLKDVTADGDVDLVDFGIQNWEFIVNGPGIVDMHVFTDGDGEVTLTGLAPGTYTVDEVTQTNWTATAGTQKSATLGVDDSDTVTFLNAPEASFDISFNDLTGSTDATISCEKVKDGNGNDVDPPTSEGSQTGDDYSSGNQLVGTYECTVVITDP